MGVAVPIIQVALTAYSAVSAVKALSEGNIMGAVMGGFGAYMGLTNLSAFGGSVAGDATSLSAAAGEGGSQASMLAEQAADFGAEGMAMTSEALGSGPLSGTFTNLADDLAVDPNMYGSGAGDIGKSLDLNLDIGGAKTGGFMESLESGWDSIVSTGKGFIDDVGNLVSTKDGSILAKAGEAVGGTGNLMKLGGMAMDYYGKEQALDAKEKAAEEGYERSVMEAARKRASVGAAPTYVYDFGGRKEIA